MVVIDIEHIAEQDAAPEQVAISILEASSSPSLKCTQKWERVRGAAKQKVTSTAVPAVGDTLVSRRTHSWLGAVAASGSGRAGTWKE
jgi:hypothetical protein